jgi:glycosyltransferase involved in cell wall biosynthesis
VRKVAFLFKRGRKARLTGDEAFPSEFFYGYVQMADAGVPVELLDEDDFGLAGNYGIVWKLLSAVSHAMTGVHLWAVRQLAAPAARARLNEFAVLVATTNTFGLSLALLKRLGLLEARVVFIAMGVADLAARPMRRWVCRWLLGAVQTVTISKGELAHLREILSPRLPVAYIPFGVDSRFWTPGAGAAAKPYVLSIGNDPRRDYATLLAAWRPEFPLLRIVTSQSLPATANVEVIAGDWRHQLLSDDQICDLYRAALFVVLPIRATYQPSGQSACLQAMACGKAVILSDMDGLWDRELMVDGESCVLISCGSPDVLGDAVADLLADPARAAALGAKGRRVVEAHLNIDAMAAAMREVIG